MAEHILGKSRHFPSLKKILESVIQVSSAAILQSVIRHLCLELYDTVWHIREIITIYLLPLAITVQVLKIYGYLHVFPPFSLPVRKYRELLLSP